MELTLDEQILMELRRTNALLRFAFSDRIADGLRKVVTTDDRKRMWTSIDGTHTSSDLSKSLRIPKRTVDFFLSTAEEAGILIAPRGKPPVKLIEGVSITKNPQPKSEASDKEDGE